jgi:hypothetical protein
MTLTCCCGSKALTIDEQDYSEHRAYEVYVCQHCDRQGSLTMYDDKRPNFKTGCLRDDAKPENMTGKSTH